MNQPVSFALGDVIAFKDTCIDRCSTFKSRYYITDCSFNGYAVNGCAWYNKEDLILLHRATEISFKTAYKAGYEEKS